MTFILFTKSLTAAQYASVSVVFIVCRIFDAVIDPLIGGLIENTRSRWGKFKPWIVAGMLFCGVSVAAVFSLPVYGWAFVGFVAAAYLLFSVSYSINDIAYWGMMPALTTDQDDRSKLAAFSGIAAGFGIFVISTFVPLLTAGRMTLGGSASSAYAIISVVAVLAFYGFQCFTLFGVKEESAAALKKEPHLGLREIFKIIAKNDQLLWTVFIFFIQNIGASILSAGLSMLYIYFVYGYNGFLLTVAGVLGAVTSLIVMLLFPGLLRRMGQKRIITLSVIAMIAAHVLIFFAGTFLPPDPWPLSYAGIVLGLSGISMANALFFYTMTVALANTVEYNEWKTGRRNEGLIFSLRPFMLQLNSAFVQLIIMIIYLSLGITPITGGISDIENAAALGQISGAQKTEQVKILLSGVNRRTITSLRVLMLVIPVILVGLAYALYQKKIKLDEKKYAEITAAIAARGGGSFL
jgi:melibiose permease/lactose/raffinose/galactose permease